MMDVAIETPAQTAMLMGSVPFDSPYVAPDAATNKDE